MPSFQYRQRVHVSAAQAWDFAVEHQPENHPRWEPEVVSARREGPVRVGARGVMVRSEWGKVQEAPFEIVEVGPGRRVVYDSGAGGFHLHLAFAFEPVGEHCDLVVDSRLRLTGALRLMWPLFLLVFPMRSRRISRSLAAALEANVAPAH